MNLARAHGDPALLIGAFTDRYFTITTPADFSAKAGAADEIIGIAESAGRPDLALSGHEWRFACRLGAGDLAGALAALADLETLAGLMPSPRWRYTAAIRRSGVLGYMGDLDGAFALSIAAADIGGPVINELELTSLELATRLSPSLVYGITGDPAIPDLYAFVRGFMSDIPVAFPQIHLAITELYLGDHESARRRIAPWVQRLDAVLHAPEGLGTLGFLAACIAALGWREAAHGVRQWLEPFGGRLTVINGVSCDLTVDNYLADLALLEGDDAGATHHARAALQFARSMPSPPLVARSLAQLADAQGRAGDHTAARSARDAAEAAAEPIGLQLPPVAWAGSTSSLAPTTSPAPASLSEAGPPPPSDLSTAPAEPTVPSLLRPAIFRRDEGSWVIDSALGSGRVPDSIGLRQLAELLAAPAVDISAVDLSRAGDREAVLVSGDLGPALDARAKRDYRRRITELQSEIDEAETNNDIDRATKHRIELDALLGELRRALGLGGRDRPQGSAAERARVNTARNIRRAIAAITAAAPDLGAHLRVSVRTGHHCVYAPEPAAALDWAVER